jgi:glycosyltransferase involved in cell wall biosynthesis
MRELSGYFVSSIQQWKELSKKEIWVVYWPTHRDAPFQWSMASGVHWIAKEEFLFNLNQDLFWRDVQHLFVAGWGDADYNTIVKQHASISKTILFDTQWSSSLKMYLGRFWLYFKYTRYFQSAWVPGNRQRLLAENLFFRHSQIFENFYVGDQFLFDYSGIHSTSEHTPLNIVFAGRLIDEKGILPFIQTFLSFLQRNPNLDWRLHICGTGPLMEKCPSHEKITYHGFVQPKDLAKLFKTMDVFILPSVYEPWGVVVHEAAFSGLALIVSDAVGAADQFVEVNHNGWIVPAGDTEAIIRCIHQYGQMSTNERLAFSKRSQLLARSVDVNAWVNTIRQILNEVECVG